MKTILLLPIILLPLLSLTGCATIVNGRYQQVTVQTQPPGSYCVLTNDKGRWVVNSTPNTVNVHRSMDNLHITCQKPGYKSDVATYTSHATAIVLGNVLAGGVIGVGIDAGDGSAFSYPNQIKMILKQSGQMN